MMETYFTPEQQDTLARRRTQLGTDAIEALRTEWLGLVEQIRNHRQDGTPVDDPRVQVLTRRWDEIGTAFHDGDPQIVTAANQLWRDTGPS